MLISKKEIANFMNLLFDVSKATALEAHKYIEQHSYFIRFGKTAKKLILVPKEIPKYEEYQNSISFLKYDIPRYVPEEIPDDAIDYNAIFLPFYEYSVDCQKLRGFEDLLTFVLNTSEIGKIISRGDKNADIAWKLKGIITSIVERYLFVSKASATPPENIDIELKKCILEKAAYYFSRNLNINILVPICLVTFSDDCIELADSIKIVRMNEEIQKSRQINCIYEANKEDWVAACATHMLEINGYHFENSADFSIADAAGSVFAYPLEIINDVFAAIRLATGYTVGYEQMLSCPIGWIESFCCDLLPLYGAKAHSVNPHEVEKQWMNLPISMIDSEKTKIIQKIYKSILSTKCTKRGVEFALKRYNRCLLRDDEEDMLVDATIGIEALLSGGARSEITHTISSRIPVVFAYTNSLKYTPQNSRQIMKRVYNLRSRIVHGDTVNDKDTYVEINGEKESVANVAVDLLHYTLLFLLENPEYIDCHKIDSYIDMSINSVVEQTELG